MRAWSRWRKREVGPLERRGIKVSHSKTECMCANERDPRGTVRLQEAELHEYLKKKKKLYLEIVVNKRHWSISRALGIEWGSNYPFYVSSVSWMFEFCSQDALLLLRKRWTLRLYIWENFPLLTGYQSKVVSCVPFFRYIRKMPSAAWWVYIPGLCWN